MQHMVSKLVCLATVAGLGFGAQATLVPTGDYVKDGLVAHWDAIDNAATGTHDPAATAWVDLVAGRNFALSNVTVGDRYLAFSGSNSYGQLATEASAAFPSGAKTVEIVIKLDSSGDGIALHGPTESGVSFGPYGGNILINNKQNGVGYAKPGTGVTNVYATVYGANNLPSGFNLNGASCSTTNPNNYWGSPDASAWLGRRSGGTYLACKIFAIRVYGRALDADEIEYNYAVDQKRFFDNPEPMRKYSFFSVQPIEDQAFTGAAIVPELQVGFLGMDSATPLTKDLDYTVACENNFAIGTATVTVSGLGNYKGEIPVSTTFAIVPPDESRVKLTGDFSRQVLSAGVGLLPSGYALADADGAALDPSAYEISVTNDAVTGVATVWARVTSGAAAGAVVAAPVPVAVLPAEYQGVASIASTGTQQINTGVTPGTTTAVEMDFNTGTYAHQTAFFGTTWSSKRYLFNQQSGSYYFHGESTALRPTVNNADAHLSITTAATGNLVLTIDGVPTTNTVSLSSSGTLWLFGTSDKKYRSTYALRSLAITQGGAPVRDFVPCFRIADGAAGLWDLVGGKFYENAGTGEFGIGETTADFDVAPMGMWAYPLDPAALPDAVVTDRATGERLVAGTDYDVVLSGTNVVGTANAVFVGKGTHHGAQLVRFALVGVLHVDPEATGTGDGLSWANACTNLHEAIMLSTNGCDEIWVTTNLVLSAAYDGTALAVSTAKTIRGGFAGTEPSADARPAGAFTLYDGEGVRAGLSLNIAPTLTIERFRFANCRNRAISMNAKGQSATLALKGCSFAHNAYGTGGDGMCVYITSYNFFSGAYGRLNAEDCVFEDNVLSNSTATAISSSGCCISGTINSSGGITLKNCTFRRNGIAAEALAGTDKATAKYAAFYFAKNAGITATGCRFVGNRVRGVNGVCCVNGTSTFRNCVFAGNEEYGAAAASGAAGALLLSAGGAASTIDNCTFAYNVSCSKGGAAGLNLASCAATIRNSVFFGNVVPSDSSCGADLCSTAAAGVGTADYCLFRENTATCRSGAGLTVLDNIVTSPDALFVTGTNDFLSAVASGDPAALTLSRAVVPFGFVPGAAPEDFDVHLLSSEGYVDNAGEEHVAAGLLSKAIDAGDPDAAFENEPGPNGGRLNMGAYGNTAEASMTPIPARPVIADGAITITLEDPRYNQPTIAVKMSAEDPDGLYSATVTVLVGSGDGTDAGTDWKYSKVFSNVQNGDTLGWKVSGFFEHGETIRVKVTADVGQGVEAAEAFASAEATGEKPYWAGHGGPEYVIHVFPYATGKGDGTSWTDAYTDFREALKNVTAARNEVWVSTNVFLGAANDGITHPMDVDCTIRGGFTGAEDALEERPDGTVSLYDGEGVRTGLSLSIAPTVTFERFRFANCRNRAIYMSANGWSTPTTLVLRGCSFAHNACETGGDGMCVYVSAHSYFSGKYGRLNAEDCVFEDNVLSNTSATAISSTGCCLAGNMNSSGSVTLKNCTFCRNGIAAETIEGSDKATAKYAAFSFANGAPLAVTGCRFVANRVRGVGGVCLVSGASSFRNCVFAGNEEYGAAAASGAAGALRIEAGGAAVAIDSCTFAYNVSCANGGAAALNLASCAGTVSNSVFYGNVNASATAGADLCSVASAGLGTMDYCCFRENSSKCFSGAGISGGAFNLYTDDPFFVTSTDDFEARLATGGAAVCFDHSAAGLDQFDLHLLSKTGYVNNAGVWQKGPVTSKAIDAGDPDAAFENEPAPNGNRVNLGAYGNTAEASMTPPPGQPLIGAVELGFEAPYTQPRVRVEMSAETEDAEYSATVTVYVGGDGNDPATARYSKTFSSVQNGETIDWKVSGFFEPGEQVNVLVIAEAGEGARTVAANTSEEATGTKPYWADRGGGANVIHVFPYATGAGDGTSWTDAYTDLREAFGHLTAARNEIWVSTNVLIGAELDAATISLAVSGRVRGGFTGAENTAEERPADTVSLYDAEGVRTGLSINLSTSFAFERIRFANCRGAAVATVNNAQGSAVSFDGCSFAHNGYESGGDGQCIRMSGYPWFSGSHGKITCANCLFEDNVVSNGATKIASRGACVFSNANAAGGGSLVLTNCVFRRNGLSVAEIDAGGKASVTYPAFYLSSSASLTATDCRFVNNRVNGAGGICYAGGGAKFVRCVFSGNEECGAGAGSVGIAHLCAASTIDSCTFGCNATDSAALYLAGGANTITHSVFGGNFSPSGTEGADVRVASGATLASDWSLYSSTNGLAGADGAITNGEHDIWGDAKFVTSRRHLASLRKPASFGFDHAKAAALEEISVHLRGGRYVDEFTGEVKSSGGRSPAVNAGDPGRDWSNEPKPNGRRVNLGAYGNTPWATTSPAGTALILR